MTFRTRLAVAALLAASIPTLSHAQLFTLTKDQMIELTAQNPFERFPDGRPKIPDGLIERARGLSAEEVTRLEALLKKFSLPTRLPPDFSPEQVLQRAFADKKFVQGRIRFVLASRLGCAFVSEEVTRQDLLEAVTYLQSP